MSAGVLAGIAVGGALGALSRYGVSALALRLGEGWAWGTFAVNFIGCAAIGGVLALTLTPEGGVPRWDVSDALRAALIVGFLGSFTTFSTYAWEAVDMFRAGETWKAAVFLLASNALGLAAVWAGWKAFGRVGG